MSTDNRSSSLFDLLRDEKKRRYPDQPQVANDNQLEDNHSLIFFGLWVTAVGTIFNAIASTTQADLEDAVRSNFSIYGNTFEATGNALVAEGFVTGGPDKYGSYIITIGTLFALYADIGNLTETEVLQTEVKGSLTEALGTSYALFGVDPPENPTRFQVYTIYSALLQLFGNGFEAFAGITELREGNGEAFYEIGTILQAIGAVLTGLFYEGGERFL
ncbi:DUF6944 family repetitive protein [Shouchella lehensis]|uniref:Uncharacterized protein n=1 Tax=Shouchella lehensis G1 TaxID=1246626 RepID=A0A060LZ07_9BACI|nr:hypothetical protein [Shouchella lehensis]AIC93518.1 hypothetical protein BleG1_0910 [Shouchella lehensis G1]